MNEIFRFSDAVEGDPAVRAWLNELFDELGVLERASREEGVHIVELDWTSVVRVVVEDAFAGQRVGNHPVNEARRRAGHRVHVLRVDLVLGELVEALPDLVEGVPIGVWRGPDFELIVERTHDREPHREVVDVVS